jgi:acyl-CoA thioesterase
MIDLGPTLREVLATMVTAEGGWVLDAPPSWSQGRTLYGGMTAALCWAAANRSFPDLPPLRSAQFSFVGPAGGRLRLVPQLLRQGRSATILSVDAVGEDGGVAARALLTCGAARESRVAHDRVAAPAVPPPADCPPLFPAPEIGPTFARNFEMRLAAGNVPFTGGDPEFTVWTRLTRPEGADPLTALLALADALPPPAMVVFPAFGVISTMIWTVDFDRLPDRADGWFLQQSISESTSDGYSRQAMTLWNADGRRVLAARQTVAIFV